jgi:hypothetical protein
MSGSMISSSVPGHIVTYNGKDYTATAGGGNIAIRTLLPESSNATIVGGTGYEYWVNGANYPPSGDLDTVYQTPGKWRIEVRPDTVIDSLVFLHTIKIGDSANMAAAGGISGKNNYSIGVDWDNTLYYFNARGDTMCDYHVLNAVAGDRTVNIIGCDLMRSTLYDIRLNGVVISSATTDTNGVFKSTVPIPAGTYMVEITHASPTGIVADNSASGDYYLFPNPASDKIFIKDAKGGVEKNIWVSIFNVNGEKVLQKNATTDHWIPVSIPSGVYEVNITNGKSSQLLKLVIVK